MYTTDTDGLCCPHCGAEWLSTDAVEHPQTVHTHQASQSVWLMWAAIVLSGSGVWGLAALGLGRLTDWW